MRAPKDCSTMAELRLAIDALDQELVQLLVKRSTYIDRAAELKSENGWPARIPDRVEEVVSNARQTAQTSGLDPDLAETLWRPLINWSIAREENTLGPDTPADLGESE
ncbi:chorismate mutase [Cochlodiniinecator piscidefendens]|uniref:chorismate mutase n=1 Tax=Cochlodiniinecator piscidefendens TaxID=2715756 RepID=UPI00197B8C6B|nr:chorismate mutase [Cochlodiniinecator piscidefendens]